MSKLKKKPSLAKTRAAKNGEVVEKAAPKKTAKKAAAAEVAAETTETTRRRNLNDLGFVEGSDSAIIAATLVEGGFDRRDVNDRAIKAIEETNGLTNRNGGEKYVPSAVSGVLSQMMKTGKWKIEASWKLVPAE